MYNVKQNPIFHAKIGVCKLTQHVPIEKKTTEILGKIHSMFVRDGVMK